jgi:hypothetical protein
MVNNNTPERVVRLLICALTLCAACSAGGSDARSDSLVTEVGRLENRKLNEASGLARSNLQNDLYWAVNDDGPAAIHALNASGANLGLVHIRNAQNRDWEDIASFELDGTAYLVVGDIGDNDAKHDFVSLYVIREPAPGDEQTELAWRIDYRYPDGARDAESLAVDPDDGHIYVLTKRTVPAELYQLPLRSPGSDPGQPVTARYAGAIDSLPQPSRRDLRNAAGSGYGWQPTGMDIAPDGRSLLILTYAGVNYYSRTPGQTWPEALQGQAMHLGIGKYKNAEAITYSIDGTAAIVTVEKKHAPILHIELVL